MNEIQTIQSKIYEIRGRRVMLDSDLADLYMVETKNLKRAVRSNIERFPDDFMFELTKEEYDSLRCNNFNLNNVGDSLRCKNFTSNKRGGNRYLPFVFTREGIAMLSGLLRSEIAIKANINIMRAFFQMQEALLIVSNTQLQLEFFFVPDVIEKRKPLPAAQAKKRIKISLFSLCILPTNSYLWLRRR